MLDIVPKWFAFACSVLYMCYNKYSDLLLSKWRWAVYKVPLSHTQTRLDKLWSHSIRLWNCPQELSPVNVSKRLSIGAVIHVIEWDHCHGPLLSPNNASEPSGLGGYLNNSQGLNPIEVLIEPLNTTTMRAVIIFLSLSLLIMPLQNWILRLQFKSYSVKHKKFMFAIPCHKVRAVLY
jgi:hypothetical protein